MRRKMTKALALLLSAAMVVSAAGCGKKDVAEESGNKTGSVQMEALTNPDFVYVPKFVDFDEDVSLYNVVFVGDKAYFAKYDWDETTYESSVSVCEYSVQDKTMNSFDVNTGDNGNLNCIAVDKDGNIYGLISVWNWDDASGDSSAEYSLVKTTHDGQELFSVDLTAAVDKANVEYISGMVADEKGRVALLAEGKMILLDENGQNPATVEMGGTDVYLNASGNDKSGKAYVAYVSYGNTGSESKLSEIDFDNRSLGKTFEHFKSGNGNSLASSGDGKFLTNDGLSVYEYDCSTQTSTYLFNWLDSDINGQYVQSMSMLENGQILVAYDDYESDDKGFAALTKTPANEVVQKEKIVVASLYGNSSLQSAAVKFNKSNDKYQIVVKSYIGGYDEWNENTYSDAMTAMNNDLTSGNAPDVIDISNVDVEKLAAKGVFEDMGAYLDKSSVLGRDDYFASVLTSNTYDGVLVGIPKSFSLQTIVGSGADLGNKTGWTLSEMMDYGKAHPDVQLFNGMTKDMALYICMMNNESYFIDWKTGEVNFLNPEFESILEFVNSYPDDYEYDYVSEGTLVERGELLLVGAGIYDFQEIQMYEYMFQNNAAFIGYPTVDGKNGNIMMADTVYAISKSSAHKEGAWQFIENYLSEDNTNGYYWGLPANKKQFEKAAEEAIKVEYVLDENGEIMYDENGEPYTYNGGGGVSYEDGWSYTYHVPTKEEVDKIIALIENSRSEASYNEEVMNIIREEAEPFFKGQKSASAVAAVIQSRIQTYVDEN